ncbi:polysaccharide deacetylase family protein [Streptomyces bambusae]|uniref:Polysaccharide deacetylase family protein n=1 Tax=Streptomyces bambusae TaxID=1550616 RepID=A0ABS6Z118_9ACTN|nr:polysaccharide deacetylase family protein [Streptomyces bambusae]MBW5481440.1 polysaccharide deacetylase family protein [Streptomyces bambusae]
MQLVGKAEHNARRGRRLGLAALAALLVAGLGTACSSEEAAKPQKPAKAGGAAGAAVVNPAAQRKAAQQALVAATKKWGLAKVPLAAPPAPKEKEEITTRDGFEVEDHEGLPPVFTTVPTEDKVVFLTIDDGAEKDPQFVRMMQELKIPYTAFLSDYLVRDNYKYFKDMQATGVRINNHTLNHRYMPGLSYEKQRQEICGQQDTIQRQFGKRPTLFRPPYGNYNEDTLKAAKSCGIKHVPIWNAEAYPDRMEYREWDRDLHPGDIILTHFRGREDWKGTMPDMIRQVMKTVTDKGYAVARLEDYL